MSKLKLLPQVSWTSFIWAREPCWILLAWWLWSCERVIYGTACAWHTENTSAVGKPMAVFVWGRVSRIPGLPWTLCVAKGELELLTIPFLLPPGLGLQTCATKPGRLSFILIKLSFILWCSLSNHLTVFLLWRNNFRAHVECWTFCKRVSERWRAIGDVYHSVYMYTCVCLSVCLSVSVHECEGQRAALGVII